MAALSAANVAFRVALVGGPPNVKPIAFLVIVAGIVGGPLPGLAVGGLTMSISDLYFGVGFWTIETSTGMALVGLCAGLLWHNTSQFTRWRLALSGFLLTMLFDIGTSVSDALLFKYPWWTSVLALYVPFLFGGLSAYPFGIAHELTTSILLALIGPSLVTQIRKVYQ